MKLIIALLAALTTVAATAPTTAPSDAIALADAVVKASGGDVWPSVTRIKFTFNVERGGQPPVSFQHDWDIRAAKDTVTWDGKTVTVNLANPGNEADEKQAFARWTNDSYWLLAPLKLRDAGVHLALGAPTDIDGKPYQVLHVSFDSVGLTPGYKYDIFIDPQTRLLRWWDYMPKPDKKSRMSWEAYKDFNGLTLATEHDLGGGRITMSKVEVVRE